MKFDCGLLGRKLGHSFSPRIHKQLADYSYELIELEQEELCGFFSQAEFMGLNVTIPYKKDAMAYCHELTDIARCIGCVNTVVRRPDGTLLGHNTDYDGFRYMLRSTGFDPAGKKALVLGTGGASLTVQTVLRDMGVNELILVSRSGSENYDNIYRHTDAALLVNATPVGMYPNNGESPVELDKLPGLECVLDVVYNPARTKLLLDAERLNIRCANGLGMLVAQAAAASRMFRGIDYDEDYLNRVTEPIVKDISFDTMNIVLVGMPGCGKSSVGRVIAQKLGREFYDADEELVKAAGVSIPEIFAAEGEAGFRRRETEVLRRLTKESGCVISAGGGAVTVEENIALMRQNANVVWLRRDISKLPTEGRPLSQSGDLGLMYQKRMPLYQAASVLAVDNTGSIEAAAEEIIARLQAQVGDGDSCRA